MGASALDVGVVGSSASGVDGDFGGGLVGRLRLRLLKPLAARSGCRPVITGHLTGLLKMKTSYTVLNSSPSLMRENGSFFF